MKLFEWWDISLAKSFDFGADPDEIRIQEFLSKFLSLQDRSNYKNFVSNSIDNDYNA